MLQYKDEVSLNASRINAIKEIAIAYAQKKQAQNNDLIIVKQFIKNQKHLTMKMVCYGELIMLKEKL